MTEISVTKASCSIQEICVLSESPVELNEPSDMQRSLLIEKYLRQAVLLGSSFNFFLLPLEAANYKSLIAKVNLLNHIVPYLFFAIFTSMVWTKRLDRNLLCCFLFDRVFVYLNSLYLVSFWSRLTFFPPVSSTALKQSRKMLLRLHGKNS